MHHLHRHASPAGGQHAEAPHDQAKFGPHESGVGHTTRNLGARIRHRRSGGDDPATLCEDISGEDRMPRPAGVAPSTKLRLPGPIPISWPSLTVDGQRRTNNWRNVTSLAPGPKRLRTMTKPRDLALLDVDWPPGEPITVTDLIAEARAVDWDFTNWCYTSGYDASDPDARRTFECLLAYARREGGAGLN